MKYAPNFRSTLCITVASLVACTTAAAQQGCFASVAAAISAAGPQDPNGFRIEAVTRSPLDALVWARVRSCSHPEWPARRVRAASALPNLQPAVPPAPQPAILVMHAGATVTVLSADDSVHLQIAGTAIEGGALGQRVRVRIASEGEERFVAGLVRTSDTLEMVR